MKRILIVEDDFDNTTLIRLLLERQHHQVITARNGQEGLEAIRAKAPDLVVLDLDMPVMDGWGMLAALQIEAAPMHIPIVVVTAHLLPDERSRVFEAGGIGYVLKPFRPQTLIAEIERCLASSG
jgi:CheY-like chemotaxis protein